MQKLGEGKNIEEDLENYMYKVERVEKQNIEIAKFIEQLDKDFEKSIQKVGIIRYNAYKDTGSDLSFTLALLDENNNGVVLNGIYSREMSNIYAKPIENGKSTYTLSDEEQKAIERAINSTKSGSWTFVLRYGEVVELVYGTSLENWRAFIAYRGFESHPLRQTI